MGKRIGVLVACVLCLLILPIAMFAQGVGSSGTIRGTVTDSSGNTSIKVKRRWSRIQLRSSKASSILVMILEAVQRLPWGEVRPTPARCEDYPIPRL